MMKIGNNNINFNAVGGTLIKSTTKSKIKRLHMNSPMAKHIFDETKPTIDGEHSSKEIIILQVILCGEKELLIEFIEKTKEDN